jgi:nucleoside-diphosphate-sugar epimerase
MADACLFVMGLDADTCRAATKPMLSHINVGTGQDLSIAELAEMMKEVTGFRGAIRFDAGKPDGNPRKLLDVSLVRRLGWRARTPLREGLRETYGWFLAHQSELRA